MWPGLNPPLAVLFGCSGPVLTEEERAFFAARRPLGFILFGRNIENPTQLRALVASLRETVGWHAPVLIDQEGGRVQRLRPPFWLARPPMRVFDLMAQQDGLEQTAARLQAHCQDMAQELSSCDIDVNCAPVLDLPVVGAHDVIGDRALGQTVAQVSRLGRAVCDGLLAGGVMPVVKHIPGHGRVLVDSHDDIAHVHSSAATLLATDFAPFIALADAPWAMTAHVIYPAFDSVAPATISSIVIGQVIRGQIGCQALLISDDLSMQALAGDLGTRTSAALAAGCDVALHCNGRMDEMRAVADAACLMTDAAVERWERAEAIRHAGRLPQSRQEG